MTNTKEIRIELASIRRQVLKLVDKCACCGDNTKEILQIHHIVPVADGGTNEVNNLIVLCPNCHVKAHRGLISIEELKNFADIDIIQDAVNKIRKNINNPIISEFHKKLKGKLAENGLSMRKFAEQEGIVPQNLSQRIKRGSITYDEAVIFAEKLGYDIEWLKSNK